MKKVFVTNLALLLFVNLLIKPFWIFGIDRTVQNVVGAQEYGLYASLFSFSIILNILLDFGITNFNSRNIAQNRQLLRKYFSNIVVLKFLLGVFYSLLCFVVAYFLDYDFRAYSLLLFLVLNQFLLSFILYLRSNLTGLHLFKTDSIISVTDRLIAILLCGFILFYYDNQEFQIEWFIYAQTVAYASTFIIAFFTVLVKAEFFRFRVNLPFLFLIVKQSFPFALLILLMSLYTRVDIVMLERLLPDGDLQAGIYVQAFRILDAVTMFGLLFANILLPIFAGMIKRKDAVENLAVTSFFLIMVPTLIVSVGAVYYGDELMALLYTDNIPAASGIFKVLILSFIAFSTTYIFGTLLTANSSLRLLNYMATGGMFLNVVLNILLIPKYQAWGAAVASLVTQSITASIQLLMAAKIFRFRFNWKNILRFVTYVALVIIVFSYSHLFTSNWMYNMLIGSVIGGCIALLLKVVDVRDALQLFKTK